MTYKPFQISVPWPSANLSPNARGHWAKRAKSAANARLVAFLKTRSWLATNGPWDEDATLIKYTFIPPRNHHYDDDGLCARMKSYRDGIADALGVNDRIFFTCRPAIMPAEKPGRVTIELIAP